MSERLIDTFQGDIKILGESLSAPGNTENESSLPRLKQVREIWNSYKVDPSLRPSWVPEEALRFLMVSAVIGNLDKLDTIDQRWADVTIQYFMTKDTLEQMQSLAEVGTPGGVLYVVRHSVDRLWKDMPEQGQSVIGDMKFPLDKRIMFPREKLRRNRSERQREVSMNQWQIGPEARREKRLAIRRGIEQAHEKMSASQQRRWQRQKMEAENLTDSN